MQRQKRVVAVHDISCVGRCSLTVALPVLSAAGIECAVLPTAVLSCPTGGIAGYTFRDLTEDLLPIARHWAAHGLQIDAFYTGYLGSYDQIEIVSTIIEMLRAEHTRVFVDPVMGEGGRLYAGFDMKFARSMAQFAGSADLIVPNMTEAMFMLGLAYHDAPYTREEVEAVLRKLGEMGSKQVVLTSVSLDEAHVGAAYYDRAQAKIGYAQREVVPGAYHGTGDVFASALCAALLHGYDLGQATERAVAFTVRAIQTTYLAGADPNYGVHFERALPEFIQAFAQGKEDAR